MNHTNSKFVEFSMFEIYLFAIYATPGGATIATAARHEFSWILQIFFYLAIALILLFIIKWQ